MPGVAHLTDFRLVAICLPPVSTSVLTPEQLPQRLRALGWSLPVYSRGVVPGDGPAVAIVGARAASAPGMARAHHVARHLAARGVHVVSGGALGIDGAAHRGVLAVSGRTTVVLGNGLDLAYPRRHAGLFRDVLATGGGTLALLPDGTPPRRSTFPQRNRLIAALADVVLVVEADVRSGSLSTAASARGYRRLVVAWPGTRGCDHLLATGAAIAERPEDVELALAGTPRYPEPPAHDVEVATVAAAIAAGSRGVDAIAARTGLSIRSVLRALPLLERF